MKQFRLSGVLFATLLLAPLMVQAQNLPSVVDTCPDLYVLVKEFGFIHSSLLRCALS